MIKDTDYIELCNSSQIPRYPFFDKKLSEIQRIVTKHRISDSTQLKIVTPEIQGIRWLYRLGNIVWFDTLRKTIRDKKRYPSSYFMKIILATKIINNRIVNPPIELPLELIDQFSFIPLHYNKLLIIDALMHQGSSKRYQTSNKRYIYSEHAGAIEVIDRNINSIIIASDTDRIDSADSDIYLPVNSKILEENTYIFHTHPNTTTYAGRLKDGIIYEFPSVSDLLNFIKYYNEGQVQASLIICPEGIYVIRPIVWESNIEIDYEIFHDLRLFILKLEKEAIAKYKHLHHTLSDPNVFHESIGQDMSFIDSYNKLIRPNNLWVEYYPRIWRNGEWTLQQINLPYVEI